MAKVKVNDTTLSAIADAIREKNGRAIKYKPREMPEAINSIEESGQINVDTSANELAIGYLGRETTTSTKYDYYNSKATKIRGFAFYRVYNLQSVDFPNVEEIGPGAFYQQASITSYNLPKVKTVGNAAFYNAILPSTFELPAAETLGYNSFSSVRGVKVLKFPKIKSIDDYAFGYMNISVNDLTDIYVGGSQEDYADSQLEELKKNYGINIHYNYTG